MSKLDDQLQRLQTILSEKREDYVAQAEDCLGEISNDETPDSISGLLRMFDDSAADQLMFSIVHEIERWDDRTYCRALLDSVEHLWAAAPRWAQTLHIRVLNSPSTADVYFGMLEFAPDAKRGIVRTIYEAISKGWPKLAEKVGPILVRLQV
jgi:hypothetical protein